MRFTGLSFKHAIKRKEDMSMCQGITQAVADGYYIITDPLPADRHTIRYLASIVRNLFSSSLHSKRPAKNPLLEAISLHGPTGPLQQPLRKGPLIESLARNIITCLIPHLLR
jgi:hypothetical protein